MKELEVVQCQIQEWYPRFRSVSIATDIVQLPERFVSHLLEDGLFVGSGCGAMPQRVIPDLPEVQADGYEKWPEEEEDDDDGPSFPELEAQVRASIDRLGGAVVPKLNWSAPKDAVWISPSKNLKCTNFGEVRMLLKASDSVVHDLCHAFDNCVDKSTDRPADRGFVLALRKWYDLRPEMEFRAFVRGGVLLGISQREVTSYYPSLQASRLQLQDAILSFFQDHLCGRFSLDDYTFDVYVTKDWRVKLLDFNPWGASTLPLLFSWEELESRHDHDGEALLRVVEEEGMVVQPSLTMAAGVPLDYVQTGPGSAWGEFFRKVQERDELQVT